MEIAFKIITGICITLFLISFFIKNIVTAKKTGEPIKGKSLKVKVLILLIGALYTLSFICIFLKYNFLFRINFLDIPAIKITGMVLILISLIIGISTLFTMRNSWRMGITENQKTELVVKGFFKFSCNPYFLSYYLIFLGVFLAFPTLVFLIFYIPFASITHLMVLDEEQFLEAQHGKIYIDYKKSVNRYI